MSIKQLNLSEKKLFNFDFDGTLVKSNEIKENAYAETLENDEYLLAKLEKIKKNNDKIDRYGIFKKLCMYEKHLNCQNLLKKYSEICLQNILKAKEVDGAFKFLSKLKKNNKLCIINSATPLTNLVKIVENHKLNNYFDGVYGGPISKTENLFHAMLKFNLSSVNVIVIGDGENDRVCAERIKCQFVGIQNSFSNFKIKPSFIINDFNEIIDLI